MADLSMFLKSSSVLTFLIIPSALIVPRGGLGALVLRWSERVAQNQIRSLPAARESIS